MGEREPLVIDLPFVEANLKASALVQLIRRRLDFSNVNQQNQ